MPVTTARWTAVAAIATLACTDAADPSRSDLSVNAGTLEVVVTVTGVTPGSASHTIIVTAAGRGELERRAVAGSGGRVFISDLPTGDQWVRLESPAGCWIHNPNPVVVTILGGRTSRIGVSVSCAGPPDLVFYRSSPRSPDGSLERFVLEPDSAFRLQFFGASGLLEYRGAYSREDTLYRFSFDANNGEWWATGVLQSRCLEVAYSVDMSLSDFVDGTYCSDSSTPGGSGAWVSLRPMPQARWQAGAASLNGIVYVAGGVVDQGAGLVAPAAILAYDPAANTWSTAGQLISPVRAPALAAVGDHIYIVGGCRDNPWAPTADLQIFDPATRTVVAGPPMSHGRCGLAVAVQDGRIHALGGSYEWAPGESEWDTSHEVFDPATVTWSSLAPLPRARGGHGAVAIGGKIYVNGGMGDTLQVYEPMTDSWTLSGSPRARFGVGVVALAGDAYFFGGSEYQVVCCDGPIPSASVERFDPVSGSWRQMPSMPTARTGLAAAVVDGVAYVIGGSSTGGATGALAVLERFTP